MIYIDRIEGETAVCFHGNDMLEIPVMSINGKPREGAALSYCGGSYSVDEERTEQKRNDIAKKQNALFE